MIALLFYVGAHVVFFPFEFLTPSSPGRWNILKPARTSDAVAAAGRRAKLASVCNLLFAIGTVTWVASSDVLKLMYNLGVIDLKMTDLKEMASSQSFWKFIASKGLQAVFSLYGITKMAVVFFADMILYVVVDIDECDLNPRDQDFRGHRGREERALFMELSDSFGDVARHLLPKFFDGGCCYCCRRGITFAHTVHEDVRDPHNEAAPADEKQADKE
eukprot:SRR837773.12674.p2 GENE.SRR837773.12674~~SRR837773.12674.p2  ORF type:complete len:229 (-),score=38.48 SRR837773.12674:39-689(-)